MALARRTLERERPAELPLFDAVAPDLVGRIGATRLRSGDPAPLEFGADQAMALMTPVVLALGVKAVEFLIDVAKSAAASVLKERIQAWLGRATSASPVALALPGETVERLRSVLAAELAERFPGVETEGAVEAVLASLAANDPDHGTSSGR